MATESDIAWDYRCAFDDARMDECLREIEDCDWNVLFHRGAANFSHDLQCACYALAEAVGDCVLFGISIVVVGDDNWTCGLLPSYAIGMLPELTRQLDNAIAQSRDLESLIEVADAFEQEDLCLTLVEQRMCFWGVHEAAVIGVLDDKRRYPEKANGLRFLESNLSMIESKIAELDAMLQGAVQFNILSSIVHLPLLQKWRDSLADQYTERLPWWLNFSLELHSERQRQHLRNMLGLDQSAGPIRIAKAVQASDGDQLASSRRQSGWPVTGRAVAGTDEIHGRLKSEFRTQDGFVSVILETKEIFEGIGLAPCIIIFLRAKKRLVDGVPADRLQQMDGKVFCYLHCLRAVGVYTRTDNDEKVSCQFEKLECSVLNDMLACFDGISLPLTFDGEELVLIAN